MRLQRRRSSVSREHARSDRWRAAAGCQRKGHIFSLIGESVRPAGTVMRVEFSGDAVRGLSMEGRMTLCNMSVEAGASTDHCEGKKEPRISRTGRRRRAARFGTGRALLGNAAQDVVRNSTSEVRLDDQPLPPLVTGGHEIRSR